MFFDMHSDMWTDTLLEYDNGKKDVIRNKYREKFEKGGFTGGIFVIYQNINNHKNPEKHFFRNLRNMTEEIHRSKDLIHIVKEPDDFSKAEKLNKYAVMLGIEGLPGIGDQLDYLYLLEQLGIRHIGLTWNETNAFATGQSGDRDRGLTELGIEALSIMEDLRIVADVSHANDKTFWDVAKYSRKPFIASHSNSRELCPAMRNLTDEQILCIGERGGMIGLNSYHGFVSRNENEKNIGMLLNHMEHIAGKIGIDKVGFGLDLGEYYGETEPGLEGIEDVTKINNIKAALKERGYRKDEIDMLTYKNFLNYFKRIREGA